MPLEAVVSLSQPCWKDVILSGLKGTGRRRLFRNEKIDYVVSATERLGEAWNKMDGKTKESVRVINLIRDFEDGVENLPGLFVDI